MTDQEALQQILEGLTERLSLIRQVARKPLCAIFKFGGYGDFYFLLTAALAARRKLHRRCHIVIVTTCTASTPDVDLCNMAPDGSDVVRIPPADMWAVLSLLRQCCEVVYHFPGYAGRRHTRPGFDDVGQAEADVALAPWAKFYFGYPEANNDLHMSQWEVAAKSSALDIRVEDIGHCPLYMREMRPGEVTASMLAEKSSTCLSRAVLPEGMRYAVIHNKAGGGGVTKEMPQNSMQAIVDALRECGVEAVQLGTRRERLYHGAIDRRGFRWPIQCALLAGAERYVGIEGGLCYAAWGARIDALLAMGPTPFEVFRFPNSQAMCPTPRCPPCWWSTGDWFRKCPKGHPHCINLPTPAEARAIILREFGSRAGQEEVA